MALILSWVLFPLVLAVIGWGWGAAVEWVAGVRVNDSLLLPLGLAAALVVAGTLTTFAGTAPAAVTVVALVAVAGLAFAWPGWRLGRWPLLAAIGVLLVYGAPVLLSGQATFLGVVKLDDTATWFDVIDHVMSHARSTVGFPPSTYEITFTGDVGPTYPLGAFMLPGAARALVGVDIAWVFQPYLACCGAALALCVNGLLEPIVSSVRLRALLAFVAAQPALLYGYSLWGGIKEMTAAFLLALGAALATAILTTPPQRSAGWRGLIGPARAVIPLAIAAGALIQTLGVGAAGWVVPAFVIVVGFWLFWEPHGRRLATRIVPILLLIGLTALFVIPVWVVLSGFLSNEGNLINQLFSSGQSTAVKFGNLTQPLSAFQLAGIWPVGDFRVTAPTLQSVLWIGLVLIAAAGALFVTLRRRQFGVAFYVTVALVGCAIVYFSGGTPWVTGKSLALSSPALLVAALAGGGILWSRSRVASAIVVAALAGGVLWSNALAYTEVTLAPRQRMVELQHIGGLVAGKGPTFINAYEIYADRHFVRQGAPVEPAEYREAYLPLRDGTALTKTAFANLNSFPLTTLLPYRSIVLARSPVESRPPSVYHLVYQGRYYELWQRAAQPATTILEHIPYGDSNQLPYCGAAEDGASKGLCSIEPVSTNPSCPQIRELGDRALKKHATLVAFQRPAPIVARGDQVVWPAPWFHDENEHTLAPTTPGSAVGHIAVAIAQSYELWLGGSFSRGFEVSVDGQHVGTVKDQLASLNAYTHIANLFLTPGVHTFVLTYPKENLTPGGHDKEFTYLSAIALQPRQTPATALLSVPPAKATSLCGRPLNWIELVVPSSTS